MSLFTRICCPPANDKFIVLFLRHRDIRKQELDLRPSKGSTFKITNPQIRSSLLSDFKVFTELQIDLSDYFQVNIVDAVCREKPDEFNLREIGFDESKEV